jgi:hypothetical protein
MLFNALAEVFVTSISLFPVAAANDLTVHIFSIFSRNVVKCVKNLDVED